MRCLFLKPDVADVALERDERPDDLPDLFEPLDVDDLRDVPDLDPERRELLRDWLPDWLLRLLPSVAGAAGCRPLVRDVLRRAPFGLLPLLCLRELFSLRLFFLSFAVRPRSAVAGAAAASLASSFFFFSRSCENLQLSR